MQKLTFEILNKRVRVEIDGNDPRDLIPSAAFWLNLPDECPVCKSPLVFEYTTPKTYKYFSLRCTGPTPHCVNLSQRTDDPSRFYLDRSKNWKIFLSDDDADAGPSAPEKALPDPDEKQTPADDKSHLIDRITRLYKIAKDRRLAGSDRVPIEQLETFNVDRLKGISKFLDDIVSRDEQKRRAA